MAKFAIYSAQARLDFDIDHLVGMGIEHAYVTPFARNNECFAESGIILENLKQLKKKAELAEKRGLHVHPLFVTIGHPEGNFTVPNRYRSQRNLDGSPRNGFVCFRDEVRRREMLEFVQNAAQLGFMRISFDDDLRDAFCYCDKHLYGFGPFTGKSRNEIARILNDIHDHPEHEQIRRAWYEYKFKVMADYAGRLEHAIHNVNPRCRIGIFNSAKRCHDFSGRTPWQWAKLFNTDQAPVFVRLCGECYDDQLMNLVHSVGWHSYFDRCYPPAIERMLELTSVPSVNYRSPGTVLFECSAVVAATRCENIHWAWTEEFIQTGLDDFIGTFRDQLSQVLSRIPDRPVSNIAVLVGGKLGPYTPTDISVDYGATHDPLAAYNLSALVGLATLVTPSVDKNNQAVMCSAYISRDMAEDIDRYVQAGGVCLLDAIAAKNYCLYGGKAAFDIHGPVSSHRYEIGPDGEREEIIVDCPPDAIYHIECCEPAHSWTAFDIKGNCTGETTVMIPFGAGMIVVLGYDLSSAGSVLVRRAWRQRMLKVFSMASVDLPAYWTGPPAVQLIYYGCMAALINYNTNPVNGSVCCNGGTTGEDITLDPLSVTYVDLP